MTQVLTLSDLEHFRSNPMVQFKQEYVAGEIFTIVTYMIADADFWNIPLAKELRGHVFNFKGELVSAAFEKFFNIGEKTFTQEKDQDFKDAKFFTKDDGSMLDTMVLNGKLHVKTKKSFNSDVALLAGKCISNAEVRLALYLATIRYSAIFEFTHPEWRVVLDYGDKPTFTLLAARHLDTLEYLDEEVLEVLCKEYGVKFVEWHRNKTIEQVNEEAKTVKGKEGYVIRLANGTRLKRKFDWYQVNHRVNTYMRERDVALFVADEMIDDIKARVTESGLDLSLVEAIESRVVGELNDIRIQVEHEASTCKLANIEVQQVAEQYKKHLLRYLILRQFRVLPVDYVTHWKKHFLKEYSLKCVYNNKF